MTYDTKTWKLLEFKIQKKVVVDYQFKFAGPLP